ncbi:MAG TPA: hypothetical protein VHV30_04155 [Polyangiaceae bacterium]|jgi:epoxyqueuosine reductase QueG|nr:hypothetical protein [Polyangiaceae bacterium]
MAPTRPNATRIVREALAGTGIHLVASCAIAAYDARAPVGRRSAAWMAEARGVVVAASAGPALWRAFIGTGADRDGLDAVDHPYDTFVARSLARADVALHRAAVRHQRFEAAVQAPVHVDFVTLAELVGLGAPGPFGLAIHPEHGPWWALRGAWIVDAEIEPASPPARPCACCEAPCVGGWPNARGIAQATPEVRGQCIVGQASRYDAAQIAFHYGQRHLTGPALQKSGS